MNNSKIYLEHVFDKASYYDNELMKTFDNLESMVSDISNIDSSKINWRNVSEIFTITGPGSVTGIRGLFAFLFGVTSEINIPIYYCNSFDVIESIASEFAACTIAIKKSKSEYYVRKDGIIKLISVSEILSLSAISSIIGYKVSEINSEFRDVVIDAKTISLLPKHLFAEKPDMTWIKTYYDFKKLDSFLHFNKI